mmetsp:Transcript_32625/g.53029  ORF Transcript_32625/g.53029 Transcript_32625/m.53029 type:complete len:81 (+) Transcript_32625:486-728(+)
MSRRPNKERLHASKNAATRRITCKKKITESGRDDSFCCSCNESQEYSQKRGSFLPKEYICSVYDSEKNHHQPIGDVLPGS